MGLFFVTHFYSNIKAYDNCLTYMLYTLYKLYFYMI